MPRTISDEEYAYLAGLRPEAELARALYNHPTHGKEAKRLIKAAYPQISIPDYDLETRFDARVAEEDKKKAEAEKAAREKAEKDKYDAWLAERTEVQKRYGFTEDGMNDLAKLMHEKGVQSWEVAAGYKAARDPKPIQPTTGSPMWNFEKNDSFKEIIADPESYGRTQFLQAIAKDEQRARNSF